MSGSVSLPWTGDVDEVLRAYKTEGVLRKHAKESLTLCEGELQFILRSQFVTGLLKARPYDDTGWSCETWFVPSMSEEEMTLLALHTVSSSEKPYLSVSLTGPRWKTSDSVVRWFSFQKDGAPQMVLHAFALLLREQEAQYATENLRAHTTGLHFFTVGIHPDDTLTLTGVWGGRSIEFSNKPNSYILSLMSDGEFPLWHTAIPHEWTSAGSENERRFSVQGKPWVEKNAGIYLTEKRFRKVFHKLTKQMVQDYMYSDLPFSISKTPILSTSVSG